MVMMLYGSDLLTIKKEQEILILTNIDFFFSFLNSGFFRNFDFLIGGFIMERKVLKWYLSREGFIMVLLSGIGWRKYGQVVGRRIVSAGSVIY